MNLLLIILIFHCTPIPNLLNVINLSKNFNQLVITSKNGIGIYDLNKKVITEFFETENPKYGVISPDGIRVFYIKKGKELYYYNIPAREESYLTTLDFAPEKLGVGQKSVLVLGAGKQLLLDYSGFPVPDSLKEKNYNFASEELKKLANLPSILDTYGRAISISTVLIDSTTSLIFAGTSGQGIYVYSKQRGIYIDTIKVGLPEVGEIIACDFKSDTLFILFRRAIIKITTYLNSQTFHLSHFEPEEHFAGMDLSDSSLFVITNKGRIFKLDRDRLVFEDKVNIEATRVFEFKDNKILLLEENVLKLMTLNDGKTLLMINLPKHFSNLKASITTNGIAILIDGRLFVHKNDSLFGFIDSLLSDDKIIDFTTKEDTLWAITFSMLLKITPTKIKTFVLPFQSPEKIHLSNTGNLFIINLPHVAVLEGENLFISNVSLPKEYVVGIFNTPKGRIIITKRSAYMCF